MSQYVIVYDINGEMRLADSEVYDSWPQAKAELDHGFQYIEDAEGTYYIVRYAKFLTNIDAQRVEYGCPYCHSGDQTMDASGWDHERWSCTCGAKWGFVVEYVLTTYEEGDSDKRD